MKELKAKIDILQKEQKEKRERYEKQLKEISDKEALEKQKADEEKRL